MKPIIGILIAMIMMQAITISYYSLYGRIFGDKDSDAYYDMAFKKSNIPIRHMLLIFILKLCGPFIFSIIMPMIFFIGICYPLEQLYGEKFMLIFIFASAAFPLFFFKAFWSQFLSIAFLLHAKLAKEKNNTSVCLMCMLLSCLYLPTIFFILYYYLPWTVGICLSIIFVLFFNNIDLNPFLAGWHPIYAFILYICPIIFIKTKKSFTLKYIGASLTTLGRGCIWFFPYFEYRNIKNNYEFGIIILWWFMISSIIFSNMLWSI